MSFQFCVPRFIFVFCRMTNSLHRLYLIASPDDIPEQYRNTPIGLLLEYHNLGKSHDTYAAA